LLQRQFLDESYERLDVLGNRGKAIEHLLLFGWGHIQYSWVNGNQCRLQRGRSSSCTAERGEGVKNGEMTGVSVE